MAVHAHHFQTWQCSGFLIDPQSLVVRDAEFVVFQARGNVGVGPSIHVGIHSQTHSCQVACCGSDLRQDLQLRLALDIEASDAHLQGPAHFSAGLAHTRKHHLGRVPSHGQDTFQFAHRHDVKPATRLGKGLKDRQGRIGLHGVANQVRSATQPLLIRLQGRLHGSARIDVQRRSEFLCQSGQRDPVHPQLKTCGGHFSSEKGGAWRHRRAPDAAETAGVAAGAVEGAELGNIKGPFWPHPQRKRVNVPAPIRAASRHGSPSLHNLATLNSNRRVIAEFYLSGPSPCQN